MATDPPETVNRKRPFQYEKHDAIIAAQDSKSVDHIFLSLRPPQPSTSQSGPVHGIQSLFDDEDSEYPEYPDFVTSINSMESDTEPYKSLIATGGEQTQSSSRASMPTSSGSSVSPSSVSQLLLSSQPIASDLEILRHLLAENKAIEVCILRIFNDDVEIGLTEDEKQTINRMYENAFGSAIEKQVVNAMNKYPVLFFEMRKFMNITAGRSVIPHDDYVENHLRIVAGEVIRMKEDIRVQYAIEMANRIGTKKQPEMGRASEHQVVSVSRGAAVGSNMRGVSRK